MRQPRARTTIARAMRGFRSLVVVVVGAVPTIHPDVLPHVHDERADEHDRRGREQHGLLELGHAGRFPAAASVTIFAMRAARVSGRRAESTAAMAPLRLDGGKASHAARAEGSASSAAARSP